MYKWTLSLYFKLEFLYDYWFNGHFCTVFNLQYFFVSQTKSLLYLHGTEFS